MKTLESDAPTLHRTRANGVELAYFEWERALRGREASILFVHATGFHARVWDSVIRLLPGRHVIAVDQRGHGRSENVPIDHWRSMGEDLTALVRELDLAEAVGVGHSMGGHSIVETAAALPGAFQRLLLIDPVIASPGDYSRGGWNVEQWGDELHPTAKRKNHFDSPDEMFERFEDRAPYSGFQRSVLRDYCEFGLLPSPDGGGYVLACPPEFEANIYMTGRTNPGVYDSIRVLEIPVLILRARERSGDRSVMDFSSSPTWPGLVGEFRNASEVYLPESSHFLPMEAPELVAAYVRGE